MQAAINLLNTLLPMLYAVATLNYAYDFFREDTWARKLSRPLTRTLLLLHVLYLGLRTFMYEHIPLASVFEVMTTIAFAVAAVYLYVEIRTGSHSTGMFLLAFSFGFQTISSAFIATTASFPEILRSPLFGIHTGAAVLGYTAFAVSAIYGVLFLLLYQQLKSSRFGTIWRRLPSLELLASMSLRAAVLGLLFLTVTIVIGVRWASQLFPGFYGDSKFIMTLLVWCVYSIGIALHYWLGWSGRQTIFLSLVGFVLMVISMAVRLWLPSFHGFA